MLGESFGLEKEFEEHAVSKTAVKLWQTTAQYSVCCHGFEDILLVCQQLKDIWNRL